MACSSLTGIFAVIGHFESINPLQALGSSMVNGIARDPSIKFTLAVNFSESRAKIFHIMKTNLQYLVISVIEVKLTWIVYHHHFHSSAITHRAWIHVAAFDVHFSGQLSACITASKGIGQVRKCESEACQSYSKYQLYFHYFYECKTWTLTSGAVDGLIYT